MTLQNEGRELLMNMRANYSAISRIRMAIANFYNPTVFPRMDLLGLCRSLDEQHWELFMDILSLMRHHSNGVGLVNELFEEMCTAGYRISEVKEIIYK